MNSEKLAAVTAKLERMRGPGDGLGAYLGDGITQGPDVRAKQLSEALRELIEFRKQVDRSPN